MSDEYRTVTFILQQLRIDSIMLTPIPKDGKIQQWVSCPRSLIHGGDDRKLLRIQHDLPKEVTVRMFEWKAEQLHLA